VKIPDVSLKMNEETVFMKTAQKKAASGISPETAHSIRCVFMFYPTAIFLS